MEKDKTLIREAFERFNTSVWGTIPKEDRAKILEMEKRQFVHEWDKTEKYVKEVLIPGWAYKLIERHGSKEKALEVVSTHIFFKEVPKRYLNFLITVITDLEN